MSKKILSFCILTIPLILISCVTTPYTTAPNVAINKNACQKKITKIAVLPFDVSGYKGFDNGANLGENVADQYTLEFINMGYNVVERTRLEKILREQGVQMTGVIDPNDAVKAGKILGVHAMVFGTVVGQPNMWGLTMRMVSVESGIILWSANSNLRPIEPKVLAQALDEKLKLQRMSETCK